MQVHSQLLIGSSWCLIRVQIKNAGRTLYFLSIQIWPVLKGHLLW